MTDEKFRKKLSDDIKELEGDLKTFKESLKEYKKVPEGAEVNDEYHDFVDLLKHIEEKMESLPNDLLGDDKK